jgi:hypothetical protein
MRAKAGRFPKLGGKIHSADARDLSERRQGNALFYVGVHEFVHTLKPPFRQGIEPSAVARPIVNPQCRKAIEKRPMKGVGVKAAIKPANAESLSGPTGPGSR